MVQRFNVEIEMSQKLSFDRPISINEKVFRDDVWNSFNKALALKQDLVLDFRNVKFIVSTVITKLCCLGEIAKKIGIDIRIIPSNKLALYLAEMNFWHIASMNGIFSFEERYLDFTFLNKKVTNALFCIEKEALERKYLRTFEFAEWVDERTKCKCWVRAELIGINNTVENGFYTVENIPEQCKAVLKTVSGFVGYSQYTSEDKILGPIIELVHNAVWHSHGKCYFFVQTSTYRGDYERIGIDISVADTGCGLYRSLASKVSDDGDLRYFNKDDFINITDKTMQNYCSIVEALFFREQSETRGLYDIITDLAKEPRNYFCELHLINGNIAFDITEGQKKDKDGNICEMHDISSFVSEGIEGIIKKPEDYFIPISDIGFSLCVDMGITIPL